MTRRDLSISLMLAVPDAAEATAWYKRALGATELWNLGSVVGMEVDGAPFFLAQPEWSDWATVELFCDDPDAVVARALAAGARGGHDVRNHEMPWGLHRQGGFVDPFGHIWFVGDRSPLERRSGTQTS